MTRLLGLLLFSSFALALWPAPQEEHAFPHEGPFPFCETSLKFDTNASSAALPLLEAAITRYQGIIFAGGDGSSCEGVSSSLVVTVSVAETGEPVLDSSTNEDYVLQLSNSGNVIQAASVFGAMRALETLAQLVDRTATPWTLPALQIKDSPRFVFRGFLHDTARHFLTVPTIKTLIDALASSKYNIFHWHITDDQSCPYVSAALPNLDEGAFGNLSSHKYSPETVQDIIAYGWARGIRVVPEFDTPGHVQAMGVGYPQLVTPCYSGGQPDGSTGPLNPIEASNYELMAALWDEVATVFKDDYVHLGGDEVSFACWQSNPAIQAFMAERNWTDYALLEQYYEQQLIAIVEKTGKHYVVWQEIFDNGLKISPKTIVDVWKNDPTPWQQELAAVTKAGFGAILSAPWYLNYIQNPYNTRPEGDWASYYLVEPLDFTGSDEQKKLVLGGEGTMWGEYVGNSNVVSRTWPRAAAIGERLWSDASVRDVEDATKRLHQFTCELLRRGIAAEPVTGPGYCSDELNQE